VAEYCTLAEVYPLIGRLGTLRDAASGPPAVSATVPSATQAAAICAQVSVEIDGHLRAKGYVLPVEDADALAFLGSVAMNGAAYRILKSAYPAASGVSGDGGAFESLRADYLAGVALIDSGGLGVDLVAASGRSRASHGFRDSAGTALSESTLVTRVDRESGF